MNAIVGADAAMIAASHQFPALFQANMADAILELLPLFITWLVVGAVLFSRRRIH